jgi:hypothetical protein
MKRTAVFITLAVLLLLASVALAGPGSDGYNLSWWTVDGGGTTSAGGSGYTLGGTAGQPDAAVWSGGDYTLAGGFWGGAAAGPYAVYLPLVVRSP